MLLVGLCLLSVVRALSEAPPPARSEAPPPAPRDVRVDQWFLTWTAEDQDVNFTVQFRLFDRDVWLNLPSCVHSSSRSCNVSSLASEGKHGCMGLRVMAERRGRSSAPTEACSVHEGPCSPEFRLSARPGSLTVHLSRNNSLKDSYKDHAMYRVCYGEEGEELQAVEEVLLEMEGEELLEEEDLTDNCEDSKSAVQLRGLQGGQRYCARVQHVVHRIPVGLSRCARCIVIPQSKTQSKHVEVVVSVVIVVLVLSVFFSYVLIYKSGNIKRWLQSWSGGQAEPDALTPPPRPSNLLIPSDEEHFDVISSMSRV